MRRRVGRAACKDGVFEKGKRYSITVEALTTRSRAVAVVTIPVA
jgi:hypothetical protein